MLGSDSAGITVSEEWTGFSSGPGLVLVTGL
jgi:hypothetical protein